MSSHATDIGLRGNHLCMKLSCHSSNVHSACCLNDYQLGAGSTLQSKSSLLVHMLSD